MQRLRHTNRPAPVSLRAIARGARFRVLVAALLWVAYQAVPMASAAAPVAPAASPAPGAGMMPSAPKNLPEFYIREYRVLGAHALKPIDIQKAVYPFLGPGRTTEDVNNARNALLKAYQDNNYTSVDVVVPPQNGAGGVVFLQVNELTVGRLRVHGSRYYDINEIKREVPSLAEGRLIDFTAAQKELVAINQLPDRRITPVIQAGVAPNTMDVDLNVKDTLPLHGSVELNNRYSLDTPVLRTNASMSYDNLWQLGHSIGASVQVSPEDTNKVAIFSGFYTVRFPTVNWLTFTLEGTKQDSNVSTIGDVDSIGRGQIYGIRTNFKLPTMGDYFQSFTLGINYKDFTQDTNVAPQLPASVLSQFPITHTIYVPFTLDYSGTWIGKNFLTDFDLSVVFNIRGIGSNSFQFDLNRFGADRNFIYVRGDISHTQDLPHDMQLFAKVTGQVSDSPLINSEQLSVGGYDTVRGYLESEVLGDDGVIFNFEFRTPSLLAWLPKGNTSKPGNEWRFYFFTDAAAVSIQDALPEQTERFSLASFGGGTRMTLFNHLNGDIDLAIPLFDQSTTKAHNPFITFRVWADF